MMGELIEEICDIDIEFYLSCLIDRSSSKITFITSAEGGVNIEEIAKKNPEKISIVKLDLSKSITDEKVQKIIEPLFLPKKIKEQASNLVQSIYKLFIEKDANLIELNPLIESFVAQANTYWGDSVKIKFL